MNDNSEWRPKFAPSVCGGVGHVCNVVFCFLIIFFVAFLLNGWLLIGTNDALEDWGDVLTSSEFWTVSSFTLLLAVIIGVAAVCVYVSGQACTECSSHACGYLLMCRCCHRCRNTPTQPEQLVPLAEVVIPRAALDDTTGQ